jgi:hypothetical protein
MYRHYPPRPQAEQGFDDIHIFKDGMIDVLITIHKLLTAFLFHLENHLIPVWYIIVGRISIEGVK